MSTATADAGGHVASAAALARDLTQGPDRVKPGPPGPSATFPPSRRKRNYKHRRRDVSVVQEPKLPLVKETNPNIRVTSRHMDQLSGNLVARPHCARDLAAAGGLRLNAQQLGGRAAKDCDLV